MADPRDPKLDAPLNDLLFEAECHSPAPVARDAPAKAPPEENARPVE
jgi:hypothetical protein